LATERKPVPTRRDGLPAPGPLQASARLNAPRSAHTQAARAHLDMKVFLEKYSLKYADGRETCERARASARMCVRVGLRLCALECASVAVCVRACVRAYEDRHDREEDEHRAV
jgi:hypothetical protein